MNQDSTMSDQSENIEALAAALAKAQGEITGALKDSSNPFFKSRYADLASCWDACRAQLSKNGLAVIQTTLATDGATVEVLTTLAHASGQWIRGRLRMAPKEATPQGIGSCITYARRYALAAMVGLAQIDDDAESAHGRTPDTGRTRFDPPDGQPNYSISERDRYVSRFTDAFNMDADELEIAKVVKSIHGEISHKHALYVAVGEELGTQAKAIRKYLEMLKKAQAA